MYARSLLYCLTLSLNVMLICVSKADSATAVISDEGFALSDCNRNLLNTQLSYCLIKSISTTMLCYDLNRTQQGIRDNNVSNNIVRYHHNHNVCSSEPGCEATSDLSYWG